MSNPESMECQKHQQKLGNFCPQCVQFLCCYCECPHYPDVKPIPIWYIYKYLRSLKMSQIFISKDQINAIKTGLIDEFNKEKAKLKKAFKKSIELLDSCIPNNSEANKFKKNLEEMGVNDKGFTIINSLTEKIKAEDSSSLSENKSFLKYIEKGKETIKEISSITNKFIDHLDFLNVPAIPITSFLHYWSNNSLTMEDTITKTQKAIALNMSINAYAESVASMGRVFIMGGNSSGPIADAYEVDLKSNSLIPKSPMLCKKYYHSLYTSNSLIYSVGGFNNSIVLSDCERYDITGNKWISLPNLSIGRYVCASCVLNKWFLHVFGGYDGIQNLNSVERLNLNGIKEWETIAVSNIFGIRQCVHSVQIKENEAIIFGYSNESYILKMNEESMECTKHANLSVSAYFCQSSAPIFDGKFVYSVDSSRRVHKYSIDTHTWSIKS